VTLHPGIARCISLQSRGALDPALREARRLEDESGDPRLRAEALRVQADVYRERAEWPLAEEKVAAAIAAAQSVEDRCLEARMRVLAGAISLFRGMREEARAHFNFVLEHATSPSTLGHASLNLGVLAAQDGRLEDAEAGFRSAADHYAEQGDARGSVMARINQGCVLMDSGEPGRAVGVFRRAGAAAHRSGAMDLLAMADLNVAEALVATGSCDEAIAACVSANGYFSYSDSPRERCRCLRVMGQALGRAGDHAGATSSLQRALELAERAACPEEIDLVQREIASLPAPPAAPQT
jgi:tetratricopeptide (TPR) repeat protein